MSHRPSTLSFQSIQPTANLDRTDDAVYHNVMTLVEAVLELKNRLSQLPPEDYVVVVKVTDKVGVGQGGRGCPALEGKLLCPTNGQSHRPQRNKGTLGSATQAVSEGRCHPRVQPREEELSQKARETAALLLLS